MVLRDIRESARSHEHEGEDEEGKVKVLKKIGKTFRKIGKLD